MTRRATQPKADPFHVHVARVAAKVDYSELRDALGKLVVARVSKPKAESLPIRRLPRQRAWILAGLARSATT